MCISVSFSRWYKFHYTSSICSLSLSLFLFPFWDPYSENISRNNFVPEFFKLSLLKNFFFLLIFWLLFCFPYHCSISLVFCNLILISSNVFFISIIVFFCSSEFFFIYFLSLCWRDRNSETSHGVYLFFPDFGEHLCGYILRLLCGKLLNFV